MALQWTPLRLSMVSGNGVNSVPRPNYRSYRKMADVGVQYEPQEVVDPELPITNSTVAEINTAAEINTSSETSGSPTQAELDTRTSSPVISHPPPLHRPLSVQSSTTSTNSSSGEPRRPQSEDVDVDAICIQQSAGGDEISPMNNNEKPSDDKTEPDGFAKNEEDCSCGLDCLHFTMQCCECTIL